MRAPPGPPPGMDTGARSGPGPNDPPDSGLGDPPTGKPSLDTPEAVRAWNASRKVCQPNIDYRWRDIVLDERKLTPGKVGIKGLNMWCF